MKISVLVSVIVFLSVSCSQIKNKDSENPGIQFKKKIVELGIHYQKVYSYQYKFGVPDEKSAFLIELVEFDRQGNVIKRETHNQSEYLKELDNIEYFSYDPNGNLIEIKETDTLGNIKSIIKNKYENNQNTERFIYKPNGQLDSKVFYKHDNNGNNEELISYNGNGDLQFKTKYKYNSRNEETEKKCYDKNGDITNSSKLIDLSETKKEYQNFNEKGELESKYTMIVNTHNLVEESVYLDMKDQKTTKTINKYDKNNMVIEITEYENHGEPTVQKRIERLKYK